MLQFIYCQIFSYYHFWFNIYYLRNLKKNKEIKKKNIPAKLDINNNSTFLGFHVKSQMKPLLEGLRILCRVISPSPQPQTDIYLLWHLTASDAETSVLEIRGVWAHLFVAITPWSTLTRSGSISFG